MNAAENYSKPSENQLSWEQAVRWLLSQNEHIELSKACYYDSSAIEAARRYEQSEEWNSIRVLLPAVPGRALDIGAGRGIASYALAKAGWDVVAVEPDPSDLVGAGAIRSLSDESPLPIKIVEQFGEKLPLEAESFDLVFARQSLHHAHDLEALVKEAFRVLKPGGVLVAIREHVVNSDKDLPAFFDRHPLHHKYGGENAYPVARYLGAFRQAGLRPDGVWGPFESPINYAPLTPSELRGEMQKRIRNVPVLGMIGGVLNVNWIFRLACRIASRWDQSPGRLYSFRAGKPL